jgi:hypothetical protein
MPISHQHHIVLPQLREFADSQLTEPLMPVTSLAAQYQISTAILWDCALALNCQSHTLDGQIYFTTDTLKRLEQLIKRIEISWGYTNFL